MIDKCDILYLDYSKVFDTVPHESKSKGKQGLFGRLL